MTKQTFLLFQLGICLYFINPCLVFAKPVTDPVYTVPSPGKETPPPEKKEVDLEQSGLDPHQPLVPPPKAPTYHLEPRPSFTLALSRAYEVSEEDHSGWIGFHAAPWMTATTRFQVGLDLHEDIGWLQLAAHSLPTRNLYRLYWGGGLSLILDADRELRPIVDLDSYHLFLAGGWEFQLLKRQNARFELSYHQGLETSYAKATLGYTLQF
jgi:hypothetical protein